MFNKDYEVYDSEIAKDKRWLFLNRSGGGFSSEAFIDLENYVRDPDAEDPKKGEVLWKCKYDENPDYRQQYGSDSSSDGFSSSGFRPSRRKLEMRWKMESKATIKSVKNKGQKYKIKVKAKGTAQRIIRFIRNRETGELERHYFDSEEVKKISYKIKDAETGESIDKFSIKGLKDKTKSWKCEAFKADKEGGFFFSSPTKIETRKGVDPGFALLMAHICTSEFHPTEIKKDFHPNWERYDGWNPDAFGNSSGSD